LRHNGTEIQRSQCMLYVTARAFRAAMNLMFRKVLELWWFAKLNVEVDLMWFWRQLLWFLFEGSCDDFYVRKQGATLANFMLCYQRTFCLECTVLVFALSFTSCYNSNILLQFGVRKKNNWSLRLSLIYFIGFTYSRSVACCGYLTSNQKVLIYTTHIKK